MRPRALSASSQGGCSADAAACADDPPRQPFPYPGAGPPQKQPCPSRTSNASVEADLAADFAVRRVRATALGLVHTHVSLALAPTVLYTLAGWEVRSHERRAVVMSAAFLLVCSQFLLVFALQRRGSRGATAAAWPGVCVAVYAAGVVAVR